MDNPYNVNMATASQPNPNINSTKNGLNGISTIDTSIASQGIDTSKTSQHKKNKQLRTTRSLLASLIDDTPDPLFATKFNSLSHLSNPSPNNSSSISKSHKRGINNNRKRDQILHFQKMEKRRLSKKISSLPAMNKKLLASINHGNIDIVNEFDKILKEKDSLLQRQRFDPTFYHRRKQSMARFLRDADNKLVANHFQQQQNDNTNNLFNIDDISQANNSNSENDDNNNNNNNNKHNNSTSNLPPSDQSAHLSPTLFGRS